VVDPDLTLHGLRFLYELNTDIAARPIGTSGLVSVTE